MKDSMILKINRTLTEDECWAQFGYYGIFLSVKDDEPKVLPEVLLIQSLKYIDSTYYSKFFSLILDWGFVYSEYLRADVLEKEYVTLNDRDKRILGGLLEIFNKRKFRSVLESIRKDLVPRIYHLAPETKLESRGIDPVFEKYGILCQFIERSRDDKKVFPLKELLAHCTVFKIRVLVGANARADYMAFRELFPNSRSSDIRLITHTSKTSSVNFEKAFKMLHPESF